MDTFIESVINWCEDCQKFHLYSMWEKGNHRKYLTDGSGAVTPLDAAEAKYILGSQEQQWKSYYADVYLSGGDDYLKAILVDKYETQAWVLRLSEHGVLVYLVGGYNEADQKWLDYKELPKDVYEFGTARYDHGLSRTPIVAGVTDLDVLEAVHSDAVEPLDRTTYRCQVKVLRADVDIKAEIKRMAAVAAGIKE